MLRGLAGTGPGGSFFALEPADAGRAAHRCSVPPDAGWWKAYVLPHRLVLFSPNLVWLCIALLAHRLAPYPLLRGSWHTFLVRRSLLNVGLVLAFFGFWHVTLYWLGWSHRPFNPRRTYRWGKVLHNVFHSCLGALVWTLL